MCVTGLSDAGLPMHAPTTSARGPGQRVTDEQRSQLCADHLAWAEGYLAKSVGHDAVEYAGQGLLAAIDSFDPNRGVPFRSYASQVIRRDALDAIRSFKGGVGTARRRVTDAVTVHEGDSVEALATPESRMESRERQITVLGRLRELEPAAALTGLAMAIGLSPTAIHRLTRFSSETINAHAGAVRRLLSDA